MIANRLKQIKKGKIWQIYNDITPDEIIFEGSATSCFNYLSENRLQKDYKAGKIRVGKLLWEK